MTQETRGALAFALGMMLSGTLGVMVVETGLDAVSAVFWRCALALPFLLGFAWLRGAFRGPRPALRLWGLALLSGVLFVIDWIALFAAYRHIPVGTATIILNLYPFLTLGLAALLLGERPGWHALGWVVLAFGGFLLAAGLQGAAGGLDPVGVGLSLLAALAYAAATLVGRFLKEMPSPLTSLVQMSVGALALAPLAAMPGQVPPGSWGWMLAMAVGPTACSYVLMNLAFGRARLPVIAVLSFIYPLVAVALDAVLYGVVLTAVQAAGFALIVLASLAVTFRWPLLPGWRRGQPA